jgi:hypothetical protein
MRPSDTTHPIKDACSDALIQNSSERLADTYLVGRFEVAELVKVARP